VAAVEVEAGGTASDGSGRLVLVTAELRMASAPDASTVWRPVVPVDVRRTLAPLHRGRADPTHQLDGDGALWRTSQMRTGPVSYRLSQLGLHEVHCAAWGPGAPELVAGLPDLLGGRDLADGFEPRHPLLAELAARLPGLRVPRTGRVVEALVPAVLEQKVTGAQAKAAFRRLVLRFGTPAPGPAPAGMCVPPSPDVWRRVPSWEWHRAGVEPPRSRTICAAMRVADRLEETVGMPPSDAARRLLAVQGVGAWTAAEVAQRALGDTDALSVGDYHLAGFVGWALLGRPLDDDGMVSLLEPWRPHRYRVVRLLECSGRTKPRFGARLTIQDHRAH
jgi:3-methyladenine DNA glycosylase/8-oxoguanine DNA glycosylase